MAHTPTLSLALSLSLIGVAASAPAAEPATDSATSSCALGGSGADATGNDCGALVSTEFIARYHTPALVRVIRPAAAPVAHRPAPTAAPRPAANWPEGQTDCATAGGGADATGNDCNGLASHAALITTPAAPAR